MKWYIWAMIAIAVVAIGYFGYKMFVKGKEEIEVLATIPSSPRILTNSATQNVDNDNQEVTLRRG